MTAYLYIHNPKYQPEIINDIIDDINGECRWSCGITKRIKKGDTFFLMRLGVEPKGIIGFGHVLSEPKEEEHWNEENASKALFTEVSFRILSSEPLISHITLQNKYPHLHNKYWTPQASGKSIPDDIAVELQKIIMLK